MTHHIQLRGPVIRGTSPGGYRADPMPLTTTTERRRCGECGCHLRRTNPRPLCDPCDDRRLAGIDKAQRWFQEHGL